MLFTCFSLEYQTDINYIYKDIIFIREDFKINKVFFLKSLWFPAMQLPATHLFRYLLKGSDRQCMVVELRLQYY